MDARTRISEAIAELAVEEDHIQDNEMIGDWVLVCVLPSLERTERNAYVLYTSPDDQASHITTGLLHEAVNMWTGGGEHDH